MCSLSVVHPTAMRKLDKIYCENIIWLVSGFVDLCIPPILWKIAAMVSTHFKISICVKRCARNDGRVELLSAVGSKKLFFFCYFQVENGE